MNHTQNYQLSLWEKTDRVFMDDFNEDNRKIDAALTGKLGPMELIYESDIGQSFRDSHTVDMSFIDWNDWSIVVFMFLAYHIGSDDEAKLTMSLPNVTLEASGALGAEKLASCTMVFLPLRNANNLIRLIGFPSGRAAYGRTNVFNDLTELCIRYSGPGYMSNGSRVVFYGIK